MNRVQDGVRGRRERDARQPGSPLRPLPAPRLGEPLAELFAPVRDELRSVEEILKRELACDDRFVERLARHAFGLGGKRLRPALLLLSGKALGRVTDEHITLAAVVEMIHTATLVHDDVLDEAALRRHRDTVNARFGNEASVLLGDFLFTHAFYLASTTDSTFACRTIGRATNVTCEGEMRQLRASGDLDISEHDYLAMVEAKTAALCACCCRLGAHFAAAPNSLEEALADYGRLLGIAFQIFDDLLDVTDLEKRKATLPLIHLLSHLAAADRPAISAILSRDSNHRAGDLLPWLMRHGSLDYARDKAAVLAGRAKERLSELPPCPSRDSLERIADFVVARRR
jgi:octaprenyl-diphosphate synthase